MPFQPGLGPRIADARREAGLDQKSVSEQLGISIWALDQFEADRRDAAVDLSAVAKALGSPMESLVSEEVQSSASGTGSIRAERELETAVLRSMLGLHSGGHHFVLATVALLVLVRFFTEIVHLLPRAANFIDIPLFLTLGLAAASRTKDRSSGRRHYLPTAPIVIAFISLSTISVGLNLSRIEPGPVLVFLYSFLAPLGVYAAVYRLWPAGKAASLSRLLVILGVIQVAVVGLVDLPRFASSSNPDVVSGTFGTNAYQLVFFLLIVTGLLAGILTIEPGRMAARAAPAMLLAILGTIFLAQYRALLATTGLTILLIAVFLGGRGRGLVTAAVIAISFGVTLSYVASHFPGLQFAPTISTFRHDPGFFVSKRLNTANTVASLYNDKPSAIAFGTGPGTFSSRAWQTFAYADSSSKSNVQGSYVKILNGGRKYRTDVSDKYVLKQLREGTTVQGSRALASPFSSYLSLMAEVGLLGFFLLAGLYVRAAGRAIHLARWALRDPSPGDPVPALLIAAAVAFSVLLQMAALDNWLEVTRVTFVAWILLAVGAKEVSARSKQEPA
jgi:transcriptional regulator with XRE-family HTH domain